MNVRLNREKSRRTATAAQSAATSSSGVIATMDLSRCPGCGLRRLYMRRTDRALRATWCAAHRGDDLPAVPLPRERLGTLARRPSHAGADLRVVAQKRQPLGNGQRVADGYDEAIDALTHNVAA